MAGHSSQQNLDAATLWGGKLSPYGASYGKLMMWFFLVSDALTFGGLLTAYGFIRHTYEGEWPVGEEVFHHFPFMGETPMPLIYVAFMTFILIVSSVTMVLAVEAGHRNDRRGVTKWLLLTVVGGFIFLGSQVWEWSHFIHGSHFGKIELEDGSYATVHGEYGPVKKVILLNENEHMLLSYRNGETEVVYGNEDRFNDEDKIHGSHVGHGGHGKHTEDDHALLEGAHAEHRYREALTKGYMHKDYELKTERFKNKDNAWATDSLGFNYENIKYILQTRTNKDVQEDTVYVMEHAGMVYAIYKEKSKIESLAIVENGTNYKIGDLIEGKKAQEIYDRTVGLGDPHRIVYGANLKQNEYGPVQYGQFFFFITGFHGFHVFSGVIINLIILIQVLMGVMERRKHYEMVEKVGLYWHFVDLVWVFVFTFFYLI